MKRVMGLFAATAALNLDAISILGVTMLGGALLIITNLVVDVLYAFLDPRIRLN